MSSDTPASHVASTSPVREFHWRSTLALFAATVGLLTGSATVVSATLGLFVAPVSEAFGIGRGVFALLSAMAMLIGAAVTPFAGRLMDRFGVRRLVLPTVAALGCIQLALSQAPPVVPALVVLVVLQGLCGGVLTPLAYTKVISLWFHRKRGIMLATASAIGIGAGAGIAAQIVGAGMAAGGWRAAYLTTGIYVLVFGLPVLALFLREPRVAVTENASVPADVLPGLTRGEALRTPALRLILLAVMLILGATTIMMFHGPALLAERGLTLGPAFLTAAALGSMSGQLISGVFLDRINSPKVGLPFAIASALGGITILHFGTTAAIVLPAAFVMGLGQGAEVGLAAYYVTRFFGLKAFGAIFGIVVAVVSVSAGLFPALVGFVFDATGGYGAAIPALDLMMVLTVAIIWLLPPYRFDSRPPVALAH